MYKYWRAALRGEKQDIFADKPQGGFYKRRLRKDSPWFPVAIWPENGALLCSFQGKEADPYEQWTWVANHPVTEEAYRFYMANNHWPDEPAPLANEASPGFNMPDDPFAALMAEVVDKLDQGNEFLAKTPRAQSETDANMARNIQAALLQLKKRGDAMHKAEKQPYLDACLTTDTKFAFRKAISAVADRLRTVFEVFMKAEEARQCAEAQKKFEEDRRKAEDARKAAEEERKKLEAEDPIFAFTVEPEPLPELPLAPEPVKINVGGGVGRKAGLKTVHVGRIVDWEKVLQHFSEHQQVRDLLQKLVDADVRLNKAKCAIPGVAVEEDRRAA